MMPCPALGLLLLMRYVSDLACEENHTSRNRLTASVFRARVHCSFGLNRLINSSAAPNLVPSAVNPRLQELPPRKLNLIPA